VLLQVVFFFFNSAVTFLIETLCSWS